MGQTGFCENLRFPAFFFFLFENLQFPSVSCENLRLRHAVIPRKSKNLQKSAKICEKLRIWLSLSLSVHPFYLGEGSGGVQSTGLSQKVRATGRDESLSVPSPEKLFKTRDLELPLF